MTPAHLADLAVIAIVLLIAVLVAIVAWRISLPILRTLVYVLRVGVVVALLTLAWGLALWAFPYAAELVQDGQLVFPVGMRL